MYGGSRVHSLRGISLDGNLHALKTLLNVKRPISFLGR